MVTSNENDKDKENNKPKTNETSKTKEPELRKVSDEDFRKRKWKKKAISAILLIALISLVLFIQSGIPMKMISKSYGGNNLTLASNYSANSSGITCYCPNADCATKSISKGLIGFVQEFVNLKEPLFIRLMIFLGVLYLIQIVFSAALDLVEVLCVIFLVMKKSVMWIWDAFKEKKDNERGCE